MKTFSHALVYLRIYTHSHTHTLIHSHAHAHTTHIYTSCVFSLSSFKCRLFLLLISLKNSNALFSLLEQIKLHTRTYKLLMFIAKQSSRSSNCREKKVAKRTSISQWRVGGSIKQIDQEKEKDIFTRTFLRCLHSQFVCTLCVVLWVDVVLLSFSFYFIKF